MGMSPHKYPVKYEEPSALYLSIAYSHFIPVTTFSPVNRTIYNKTILTKIYLPGSREDSGHSEF